MGGWVAGWSPMHNHATLWSNLLDIKISSTAEIPKKDRVWQKCPYKYLISVLCEWDPVLTSGFTSFQSRMDDVFCFANIRLAENVV